MILKLNLDSIDDYRLFLKAKSLPVYKFQGRTVWFPNEYAGRMGMTVDADDAAEYQPIDGLFDYQRDIARLAIKRRKFAAFVECFKPGALVKLDGRYAPIEDCQVGMSIETMHGESSIERVMSREYSGEMIDIKTMSGFFPISVTPNHKFYVLRRKRCLHKSRANTMCSPRCITSCAWPIKPHEGYEIELAEASELISDDCLLFPQSSGESSKIPDHATDEYLRFCGMWLAEGNFSYAGKANKKRYGIHLAFHVKEEGTLAKNAIADLKAMGVKANMSRCKASSKTLLVYASSNQLASLIESEFGEHSNAKRLPRWFFGIPKEKQLILLHALFQGDGHINLNPPCGKTNGRLTQHIRFVTVSYELASGVRDALMGMGIQCSCMTEKARVDKKGINHKEAYRIQVNREFMERFGYSIERTRRLRKQIDHEECGRKYTLVPIRKIEKSEYSGKVYNLTSSGHDSYLTDAGVSKNCGLGKSLIGLEFARHARSVLRGRKTLVVTPLMVVDQMIEEAHRFYGDGLPVEQVKASGIRSWMTTPGDAIGVTNYDALKDDLDRGLLGCLVIDESSSLKSFTSKHAQQIIKLGKGLDWKLCMTGTPAPNDRIEFANHAVFLDAFPTINSFLAKFFINRGQTQERWEMKPHAVGAFYKALSHWSIFMSNPATYGWKDNCETIPPIHVHIHDVDLTNEQQSIFMEQTGAMFASSLGGITTRATMGQLAKGKYKGRSVPTNKPQFIKNLIESWPDESTLIWCIYDDEQRIMERTFHDAASISGPTSHDKRIKLIGEFQRGERKILISKAKVLGYGLNLQVATRHVFSGLQDSLEGFHQCVKRSNRVGSTRPLNVHVPVTDVEMPMLTTVLAKAKRIEEDTRVQEELFRDANIL